MNSLPLNLLRIWLASGPKLKGRIDGLKKIWIYSFHSKVRAQFVLVQVEEVRNEINYWINHRHPILYATV